MTDDRGGSTAIADRRSPIAGSGGAAFIAGSVRPGGAAFIADSVRCGAAHIAGSVRPGGAVLVADAFRSGGAAFRSGGAAFLSGGAALVVRLVVLGLVAVLPAAAVAAQANGGTLESAVMEVDLGDARREGVAVVLEYRVRPGRGVTEAPLAVIEFGETALAGVEARVDGRPARLTLGGAGPRLTGTIGLPEWTGDAVAITLRYRIIGAVTGTGPRRRVRLPVVAVAWPPAEALPGTFIARARLPEGTTVYETFPALSRTVAGRDGPMERIQLQVVPAMVSFRTTTGTGPLLGLRRGLDLALLLAAVIAVLSGWRYLRRRTRQLEAAAS